MENKTEQIEIRPIITIQGKSIVVPNITSLNKIDSNELIVFSGGDETIFTFNNQKEAEREQNRILDSINAYYLSHLNFASVQSEFAAVQLSLMQQAIQHKQSGILLPRGK